jgi:transposase
MMIIGCDYHPGFQQIAFVDTDTGELQERRLEHREEAEKFYRDLAAQGVKVRVGIEASGHARWFERLLSELHTGRLLLPGQTAPAFLGEASA